MNKQELVTAIMGATDEHKKSHLTAMKNSDLEAILAELTPAVDTEAKEADAVVDTAVAEETKVDDVTPDENEQKVLATIPTLDEYTGTDAELIARDLLKKVEALHKIPFATGRKHFRSLRKKGYISTKGKAESKKFTTLQLTALGIQYFVDNDLPTVVTAAVTADAPTEEAFDAKIWLDDLKADYGDVTSEMLDELVSTKLLTKKQAEEIYDLSCNAA